jgi:two-component system LytT family response regulator
MTGGHDHMDRADRTWRAVIVDDEPPARATLRLLLGAAPDFSVAAECGHGEEALRAVARERPDVLFLDVQMPGMDGFEVLRQLGPAALPALVFVTAYDRYALQAFEQHALDYLLKPFSDERFAVVLDAVRARLRERTLAAMSGRLQALLQARARQAPLAVRDGSRTVLVTPGDILWVEAEDYCARIHARGRDILVRDSLRRLERTLGPARFARVHRSALVNVDEIREIVPLASGDQRVVLSDGAEIRASRTHRAELLRRLGQRSQDRGRDPGKDRRTKGSDRGSDRGSDSGIG